LTIGELGPKIAVFVVDKRVAVLADEAPNPRGLRESHTMKIQRFLVCVLAVVGGFITSKVAAQEPELAMKGYCPVSIQTLDRAVPGDAAHHSVFQGLTYHFADADAKAKFDADPAKYAPQFAGLCTTALGGSYGNRLPSDPTVYRVTLGRLYLFSSVRARDSFDKSPDKYITTANERFNKPALGGNCLASYTLKGQAVPGDLKYTQVYSGLVYYLADEAAQAAFLKEPTKFVPAYDGFCAEGAANGKRFPGDPKVFEIHEGRLYFFFDDSAKKAFDASPAEMVKKADAQWPELHNAMPKP